MSCYVLLQGIVLAQELNPHLLGPQHCQAGSLPLEPPRKPHSCGGPTIKYTRIFYFIGVGTPNLCLVQGSTTYTYASVHILYYKIETKINILKDGFNIED